MEDKEKDKDREVRMNDFCSDHHFIYMKLINENSKVWG